jgi:hypothetical protein
MSQMMVGLYPNTLLGEGTSTPLQRRDFSTAAAAAAADTINNMLEGRTQEAAMATMTTTTTTTVVAVEGQTFVLRWAERLKNLPRTSTPPLRPC